MSATLALPPAPSRTLRVTLWCAQVLVGLPFIVIGATKLGTPIPKLATMLPWTGQYPEAFVRFIGLVDIAGGVGILLPALTGIKPGLTVAAALGCTVLQIAAIVFHTSRGEIEVTPLNVFFLALSAFVLFGRSRKAPIPPRTL